MVLLRYMAPLHGGSGQWNSVCSPPHCFKAVGGGASHVLCPTTLGQWAMQLLRYTATLPWGSGESYSCGTLLYLGARGSGTLAVHGHTCGQWAVEVLWHIGTPPWGTRQWNSCNTLPHCPGAMGSRTPAVTLPWGNGQWNSFYAPPHCQRAVGTGTPSVHCHTAREQWALELL